MVNLRSSNVLGSRLMKLKKDGKLFQEPAPGDIKKQNMKRYLDQSLSSGTGSNQTLSKE